MNTLLDYGPKVKVFSIIFYNSSSDSSVGYKANHGFILMCSFKYTTVSIVTTFIGTCMADTVHK